MLTKITLETALRSEICPHLGYDKVESKEYSAGNSRNCYSNKYLNGDRVNIKRQTPRDREESFEPH